MKNNRTKKYTLSSEIRYKVAVMLALLLSEAKRKEKQTEIQNLMLQFQRFQQEKWGPQGEVNKKQSDLMMPVIDKINATIIEIGNQKNFDYILDVAAGVILHVSNRQVDLTENVIVELNAK